MSKTKIEKLTPEQEAQFPVYVDKWVKIGTNTTQPLLEETAEIVRDFRELIKLEAEVPLYVANNPIESWVACCLLEQKVAFSDLESEIKSVFNGNPKKYIIPQASLPFNKVSLASVFSFYDYMFNVAGVDIEDQELMRRYKVWELTSRLWAIYPLANATIVCKHPTKVSLNEDRVLHCDGGPALVFDGLGDFKVYLLNGVEVPEYLAVTPSHQIDISLYSKETNADVKAEFVRKVGIERMLHLGKKVDTFENYDQEENPWWWSSEYELWDMHYLTPSIPYAPYLKMLNQTTGVWHVEAVSEGCKTIEAAIQNRFNGRNMRIVKIA